MVNATPQTLNIPRNGPFTVRFSGLFVRMAVMIDSKRSEMDQSGVTDPHKSHDHRLCIDDALSAAEELAVSKGVRLTENRRAVLMSIWSDHKAHKAYDILETLARDRPGIKPPTVYRALDFLTELGLIHRIESLNAYVGCPDPDHPHEGAFLICDGCGSVAELAGPSLRKTVVGAAKNAGFDIAALTIEAHGLCATCQASA